MKSIKERILSKISFDENTSCWMWNGGKNWFGYGLITEKGKMKYVHRLCYEIFNGVIPNRFVIDHLCSNQSCVNPEHLDAVPQYVNLRRAGGFSGNTKKRYCPKGHELIDGNLVLSWLKLGKRGCLICKRNYDKMKKYRKSIIIGWSS